MKRFLSFLFVIMLVTTSFIGCSVEDNTGVDNGNVQEEQTVEELKYDLENFGGVSVSVRVISESGEASDEEVYACREIIRNRLDAMGYTEAVLLKSADTIRIDIPGVYSASDIGTLTKNAFSTAKLEFVNSSTGEELFDGSYIESATASYGSVGGVGDEHHVVLTFTKEGRELFRKATVEIAAQEYGNNFLDIMIDGETISHAFVQEAIDDYTCIISGAFTEEEANELALLIDNGTMPCELELLVVRSFDPPSHIKEQLDAQWKNDFDETLAKALGKEVWEITYEDYLAIKYVEIANDGQQIQMFFGYDDFLEQKARYIAEQEAISTAMSEDQEKRNEMFEEARTEAITKATEAGEEFDEEAFTKDFDMDALETGVVIPEATVNHPVDLIKKASIESTSAYVDFNIIKYFKNAEEVVLMGAKVDAESILALTNAKVISLSSCTVDNVTELAKLDFTRVERLALDQFMFESEEQFEAFKPNGEKVTIMMAYYPILDGNGNVLQYFPYEITVAEMFAEPDEAVAEEETAEEVQITEEAPVEEYEVDIAVAEEAITE